MLNIKKVLRNYEKKINLVKFEKHELIVKLDEANKLNNICKN